MFTIETSPKDPERAVAETVALVAIPLFGFTIVGWALGGVTGSFIGMFLGALLALPLGLMRKRLFLARLHWDTRNH